jgi:sulfatase modifying factor 1
VSPPARRAAAATVAQALVRIDGGTFTMGSDRHYPEEAPAHRVSVTGFALQPHPVTNDEFAAFVLATGYRTLAERIPDLADYPGADPDLLAPGSSVFVQPDHSVDLGNPYHWWRWVPGAQWRHPYGPESTLDGLGDHPVVHIAYQDARAYADWAGLRLPAEAEWEFAARGGLDGAEFAWGDSLTPDGTVMANTWRGEFPVLSVTEERTSPVGRYPPNGYGLYDLIGNVWEWTSNLWGPHPGPAPCCGPDPTAGPAASPLATVDDIPRRVIKGGSHLCAPNYCRRYRPAARLAQAVDTSTSHLGFRCAA